jgi:hypothetical protein
MRQMLLLDAHRLGFGQRRPVRNRPEESKTIVRFGQRNRLSRNRPDRESSQQQRLSYHLLILALWLFGW